MTREPIRTCISCNHKGIKSELIRNVWRNGSVLPDPNQKLPGRGGYHCDKKECKERFKANGKRLKRVFRLT
ncbi:MAG: YlxR family protein [Desulfocapsaceae bacterium]